MKNAPSLTPRQIFAKNLRRYRRMQDVSQEALALKAGMSRSYVSEVEREIRNISIDNMGELAEALDVPLKDLLDPALFSPVKQADI
ncbi:MAG: helix-turn-helix transcriptional regulator [Bacteroidia bacterium]|nr:helix-turn-helix transcriptional regulator [Methylotenera sp.]